ncbi:MAG TPA: response regulator [Terriglobales bacterium]|nr:response regulator [Terriglobales bacterium]
MKILLADDSVTAQNMGKKILSEAGHEVVCVSNGAAALKKVSEQEPDLVILDIYMPGYSGLEVCQKLKETSSTAEVPVVLTVGKLEPFRKEDAQRVRAEALIVKPFEASELAAAVGRFAEIISSKPAKAKPRGKLGPQPKTKPQWDEAPEDEFVITTQKLEEQDAPAAQKDSAEAALEKQGASVEAQSRESGGEFEIKAETAEPAPIAHNEAEPRPGQAFGDQFQQESTETPRVEASHAEFSVQAEDGRPDGEQPQVMAAAAGAGGEFGNPENQPEMTGAASSVSDFAVTAPAEAPAAEPAAFEPPMAAEGISSPAVTNAPPSAAPEFSAASAAPNFSTEPVVPSVDPAFDPDRTQWVTQFPTHFGIKEETAREGEGVVSEQAGTEAGSTTPDEIAAILGNLPGGGFASRPEEPAEVEGKQPDSQPWPVEDSNSETGGWKAEEVPVEDRDKSISLAEEMNKAAVDPEAGVPEQPAALPAESAMLSGRITLEPAAGEDEQAAAAMRYASPFAAEDSAVGESNGGGSIAEPAAAQPDVRIEESGAESPKAATGPDRVAGVMHSAAMAIATRATVSAVASQLHSQPSGQRVSMGPSAIEELVGQVLERLKPKLIAEIKRELNATEEK